VKINLALQEGGSVVFNIQKFPAIVGRDKENEITLPDKSVSRKHAQIFQKKNNLFIKDLGSANGTFVNGKKIRSSEFCSGDTFQIGKYQFEVIISDQVSESTKNEWDLSTHIIDPEELETESEREGQGMLEASTSSVIGFFQKAGKILENAFELDDIVNGILDLTFQVIPATQGFVLLIDPETGEMVERAQKFRGSDNLKVKAGSNLSTTILEHAVKQGRAVLTVDAGSDKRFDDAESVHSQNIRGAICVPLKGRTDILGAIYVHSRLSSHKFTVNDLKLMTAVGAEMGVAIENFRLYEENIRAEKLAAVGQTVAGLGHCIKNILNGMEGGSFILQKGLDKGDEAYTREGWEILRRNSSRLKDLMLDMLAYSKPREPVYENIDGNSIPMEVVDLLRKKASDKGIDLQFFPDENIGNIKLDGKAMYRGILNLVTNAIDACPPEEGKVEVKTCLLPEGEKFQIIIQDNGCGISEANLSKMGKVFFSTKGSEGTGLGLSVTYKLISEHKGLIEVDSVLGTGTTFTVTLPVQGPFSA
jgi:two-component system NtrC family sensor kinase